MEGGRLGGRAGWEIGTMLVFEVLRMVGLLLRRRVCLLCHCALALAGIEVGTFCSWWKTVFCCCCVSSIVFLTKRARY